METIKNQLELETKINLIIRENENEVMSELDCEETTDKIMKILPRWVSINDKKPEQGIEVLFFNERWIDDDFNPKGIRIGFIDDVSGYVTAKWCNYHDEYHTRDSAEDDKQFEDFEAINQIPTHWMPILFII
jgi:hypothetical protein